MEEVYPQLKYYRNNKERISEQKKVYYQQNKEAKKEYYQQNKDKIKARYQERKLVEANRV